MDLTTEYKTDLKELSTEALHTISEIASTASSRLAEDIRPNAASMASINTYTADSTIKTLNQVGDENRDNYKKLVSEPAIARVVVIDDADQQKTYYICRATPVLGIANLSSYDAPIGRLASLPVGSEFTLPNGNIVEVIERAQLKPSEKADGWDSINTIVESEDFGPVTIESLRAQIAAVAGEDAADDILSQLLAEEAQQTNVINGIRRSVIDKMGLRDQPILDQYQDQIFRLPLNKRLLLLGPPGTGKTTTLIRRLGQKLDTHFLDEGEQQLAESAAADQGATHATSWLMFTPTELLKQYLKEAFAREGLAASDLRIRTWHDYRRELARNTFGILRASTGNGSFILRNDLPSLNEQAINSPVEWFEEFNTWQQDAYRKELLQAATQLEKSHSTDASNLGKRLKDILTRAPMSTTDTLFSSLAVEVTKVQLFVDSLKQATDKKIKAALNLQVNRNRSFLDELAQKLSQLQQAPASEEADQDDSDDEEEEAEAGPHTGRVAAMNAYMQAVRTQAKAAASKRTVNKNSRTGKILGWLGERSLAKADSIELGESLILQTAARRFINPVKRNLNGVPKRYKAFRRERQKTNSWYQKGAFESRDISPLELDIVLLTMLRTAGELLIQPAIIRNIDNPVWSSLHPFLGLFKNQVLVDEATDFSPIQLACMAQLAHPRLRSFFACGDFNQRLTTWGARSASDLQWVYPDFDIREVTIAYRQSQQLNDLARGIIFAAGGTEYHVSPPDNVDSSGVKPVLLEHATSLGAAIDWLASRIRDIEQMISPLPSIAVFVNSEEEVAPLADALNLALANDNIPVMACREGQVVGQESNVRVFDIQHIKGLEFEAVFFVGIDQLANNNPALFDKYLYVGTTRAATYLGITCQQQLPQKIEMLRPHFASDWQ